MSICNIILDGNYLGHSEYGIFSNYGKTRDPLGSERGRSNFMTGLANKFFHTINHLPKGGQVVFVMDSRSWRKDFFEGYKASREDSKGNKGIMDKESKERFYDLMEEFCGLLQGVGIKTSRVRGAEGDDLVYHWVKHFNDRGENCCIVSGDFDLIQCVRGPSEPWTVLYTNKNNASRLFSAVGWEDGWLDNVRESVFEFSVQSDQEVFHALLRDNGFRPEGVESQGHIIKKILCGDDGDDVPAVWTVYKGDDKSVRVTDKKAEKILYLVFNQFGIGRSDAMSRWDDPDFKDFLAGAVLRVMGDVDGTEERKKVIVALDRNAKLVWLDERELPYNLNQEILEHIGSSSGMMQDRSRWNRKGLLAGTKYAGGSGLPKGLDPLSMMELPE